MSGQLSIRVDFRLSLTLTWIACFDRARRGPREPNPVLLPRIKLGTGMMKMNFISRDSLLESESEITFPFSFEALRNVTSRISYVSHISYLKFQIPE